MKRYVWLIGSLVLGVIGSSLLLYSTPHSASLTADSLAYLAAADSLLDGRGYRAYWLPDPPALTRFPPFTSAAFAFFSRLTHRTPYESARLWNALLFGLSIFLMGYLGWITTQEALFAWSSSLFFLINGSLLYVYTYALSEPPFITLSLLIFGVWLWGQVLRSRHPEKGAYIDALLGILSGLAFLTRYVAIALVATLIILPLLLPISWRERFRRIFTFSLAFLPLPALWLLRNLMIGSNATARSFVYHPIPPRRILKGIKNFSEFLLPISSWRNAIWENWSFFFPMLLRLLFLVLLLWLLIKWWQRSSTPQDHGKMLVATYTIMYPLSIWGALTYFDADILLNWRIFSPLYPMLLALLLFVLNFVRQRWHPLLGYFLVAGALLVNLPNLFTTIQILRTDGQGFAAQRWQHSQMLQILRELPTEIQIYTNHEAAPYFYLRRPASPLPLKIDPQNQIPNPSFIQMTERIHQEVLRGKAVVAIFILNEEIPEDYRAITKDFSVLYQSDWEILFGIKEIMP